MDAEVCGEDAFRGGKIGDFISCSREEKRATLYGHQGSYKRKWCADGSRDLHGSSGAKERRHQDDKHTTLPARPQVQIRDCIGPPSCKKRRPSG